MVQSTDSTAPAAAFENAGRVGGGGDVAAAGAGELRLNARVRESAS